MILECFRRIGADLTGHRTNEQEAYDTGFCVGVASMLGLAVLHLIAERRRERHA
jgi:hypothetical protein